MNYRIAYTVICSWLCLNAFAQDEKPALGTVPEQYRVKYQLSVGGNMSKMQSDDPDFEKTMEPRYGFIIQCGISQYLAPRFDLGFSVGFSAKGNVSRAVFEDTSTNPPSKIEAIDEESLYYLNMYVLPEYFIGLQRRLGVSAGPYLGAMVSDKLYWEYYIDDILTSKNTDYNNLGYKRFDWGLSSEISYQVVCLKKQKAIFKLRWDRGLYNIGPGSAAIYNQTFALQLGVVF